MKAKPQPSIYSDKMTSVERKFAERCEKQRLAGELAAQRLEIGDCPICGRLLTGEDDAEGLVVWVEDTDYLTTGNKTGYCRDCAASAAVKFPD